MERQIVTLVAAVGLGAVLGAVTCRTLPAEDVPPGWISLFHGDEVTELEIEGGARLHYRSDGDAEDAATVIRERAELSARAAEGVVEVEVPGLGVEKARRLMARLGATGEFEVRLVDSGSELMRALDEGLVGDPLARELEVEGRRERWQHDETGAEYWDHYLIAPSRQALERYLDARAPAGAGAEFGFEVIAPGHSRDHGFVRTYLLRDEVAIHADHVADASAVVNPTTRMPEVLVELTDEGARRFGAFTGEHTAKSSRSSPGRR